MKLEAALPAGACPELERGKISGQEFCLDEDLSALRVSMATLECFL